MKFNSQNNAEPHPPLGNHGRANGGACVVIDEALNHLRRARDLLVAANAPRSAERVRRALKSVEGARRNVDRFRCHTCDGTGQLRNSRDVSAKDTCPNCAGSGRTQRAGDSL